uniref:PRRT2 n=1 Tax=Steinernema glaseri TaxID=37863 RepID=A0A1I7YXS4_9BILA
MGDQNKPKDGGPPPKAPAEPAPAAVPAAPQKEKDNPPPKEEKPRPKDLGLDKPNMESLESPDTIEREQNAADDEKAVRMMGDGKPTASAPEKKPKDGNAHTLKSFLERPFTLFLLSFVFFVVSSICFSMLMGLTDRISMVVQ